MSVVAPRVLRMMCRHFDVLSSLGQRGGPDLEQRLAGWRHRVAARTDAAARELANAASAPNASPELKALAAAVRSGVTTWEQCVTGQADHLWEVRACATAEQPTNRRRTADAADDDDVMRQFLY